MTATNEIDYNRFQSRFYKQPPNQYESHFEQNQSQEFNYFYDDSFESYNNPVWSEASGNDITEMDDPIHMANNETSATLVSFSELLNPVYLTNVRANSSSRVNFAANLMRAYFSRRLAIESLQMLQESVVKGNLTLYSKVAAILVATLSM